MNSVLISKMGDREATLQAIMQEMRKREERTRQRPREIKENA
jgi:hypothetical protein